ncbi:MAG: PEP-CTERM sorting domain-containing protein [Phycisphaerae bacterium]
MRLTKTLFLARLAMTATVASAALSLVPMAQADPMTVAILPAGDETFLEGSLRSGQIIWEAQEDLTLSPGTFRFEVVFRFDHSDPDNVPVEPAVGELSLLNWPMEFGTTIPWTPGRYSDRVGSPLNVWMWVAEAAVTSTVTFPAGARIGTVAWSTGGQDLDDIADNGSFHVTGEATHRVDTGEQTLILKSARDTKGLNPEPVPEPASFCLVLLGVLGFVRRRLMNKRSLA